jgi:hypothetical protein
MRTLLASITTTLALVAGAAYAEPPPIGAPAGATGQCNDGTWAASTSRSEACRDHQGVKTWYLEKSPTKTPAQTMMPLQTFPNPRPGQMPNAATPTVGSQTGNRPTLPGGLSPTPARETGKVWVDPESKVYYCRGDRQYGSTSNGEYMSEVDAVAKGNRSVRGMTCSS